MKRKTILTMISGLVSLYASAQQDAGFSQYFFNQLYINPAYAGSKETVSGRLVHRSQWVGMPGAPTTQSLTLHSPIPKTRAGVGVQVYNDVAGPLSNTAIQGVYSYYVPLGTYRLAFGLAGSLHNMRVDWDVINVEDKTDEAFIGNSYSWVPDAAAGLYLYKERFYAGVSATHILQSNFGLAGADASQPAQFYRTYYFSSGYVMRVTDNVDFRPSILMKGTKASPVTFDVNGSFIFHQKFFIGAGWRTAKRVNMKGLDNQLVAIAEMQIWKTLRVGYSYDWYLNRTGNYTGGTHEIMLGFDLNLLKTKMTSPIFF